MHRQVTRLGKGLMVGMLFTAYQMPGCNFSLDEATLENLLGSLDNVSEVKFEFEAGNDDHPGDSDRHGHSDEESEPGDD